MKPIIIVNKKGSIGSRKLQKGLKCLRVKAEVYRAPIGRVAINWGHSRAVFMEGKGLNKAEAVARACNKVTCLNTLKERGINTVKFTVDKEEAAHWLIEDGGTVFCRTLIKAAGGRGIVIAKTPEELVKAPLYTKYKNKKNEYRVHVFNNQVIDITEKCRRHEREYVEAHKRMVRSFDNGWVFCRMKEAAPDVVKTLALQAIEALGLDFGAVDIGWNDKEAFIFEVNTAPGLEGSTLTAYINAFRNYLIQKRAV